VVLGGCSAHGRLEILDLIFQVLDVLVLGSLFLLVEVLLQRLAALVALLGDLEILRDVGFDGVHLALYHRHRLDELFLLALLARGGGAGLRVLGFEALIL
jgi:hypothetical protein